MKANRRVGFIKLLDASQVDSLSANCREGSGGGRGGGGLEVLLTKFSHTVRKPI